MSRPTHSAQLPGRVAPRGGRLEKASMKNLSPPLYQHLRAESVSPRIKTLAADWQVWDAAADSNEGTIHIDYDGDYASERVLIVSGRATVIPDDGSPSFNVGAGDAIYFMHGFRCTWRIHEAPCVQRYGYFGEDGKELKNTVLICDVCGEDCSEESYLDDYDIDICPRCFKLDAKSAQQYEDAQHQRWGKSVA